MKLKSLEAIAGIIKSQLDHYCYHMAMAKSDFNVNAELDFLEKKLLYQEVMSELETLRERRYSLPFLLEIKTLFEEKGLVPAVKHAKGELRISLREAKEFVDSLAEANNWVKHND